MKIKQHKDRYLEEKHEPFDHHTIERQNDFTVGIAVGVMIAGGVMISACSLIYLVGSLMSV